MKNSVTNTCYYLSESQALEILEPGGFPKSSWVSPGNSRLKVWTKDYQGYRRKIWAQSNKLPCQQGVTDYSLLAEAGWPWEAPGAIITTNCWDSFFLRKWVIQRRFQTTLFNHLNVFSKRSRGHVSLMKFRITEGGKVSRIFPPTDHWFL